MIDYLIAISITIFLALTIILTLIDLNKKENKIRYEKIKDLLDKK